MAVTKTIVDVPSWTPGVSMTVDLAMVYGVLPPDSGNLGHCCLLIGTVKLHVALPQEKMTALWRDTVGK